MHNEYCKGELIVSAKTLKMVKELDGYSFWRDALGAPRYILAPMVEQSELPWRLLSRHYGAQLCYTPMLHASVFIKDARYRKENLASCDEDRPLIVQFCANDVDTFVNAAIIAQDYCQAIDLNIGCPQTIAQRGHYGAFLEDEWDLLRDMISTASSQLRVPITCKIRIFKDVDRTICYAQMLESAGCKLLTVHGRTKEQKGPHTGLASWEHIKAVKQNVKIPVFANGNIQYLHDVEACMLETDVDGVMIAEGNLHNPALFHGVNLPVWQVALEYLELVQKYPCSLSSIRGHMFKLCHHCLVLPVNHDIRQQLSCAKDVESFQSTISKLKSRYENTENSVPDWTLPFPPWICQPYVRPAPKQEDSKCVPQKRESSCGSEQAPISKKKLKKMMKRPQILTSKKIVYEKCVLCCNPKGMKCSYNMCKSCCRKKTSHECLNCFGHKYVYIKKVENDSIS